MGSPTAQLYGRCTYSGWPIHMSVYLSESLRVSKSLILTSVREKKGTPDSAAGPPLLVSMGVCMCTCVYACVYVMCICICICISYVYGYVYTGSCIHKYMHTHMIHSFIHTYMNT